MSGYDFFMIEPNVLKVKGDQKGPDKTEFRGRTYYRFMDFFYTHTPFLDELTSEEVNHLCRARARHPELISKANIDVRDLFRCVANELSPQTFLEVGAGRHPIFYDSPKNSQGYLISDADSEVIEALENQSNKCQIFSGTQNKLNVTDDHFELVMAVFVLHFPFYQAQLAELYRSMSLSGVMIANVYRRTAVARDRLLADMQQVGFKVHRVPDARNLCRDHEYWIIGKDIERLTNCGKVLVRIESAF